MEAGIYQLRQYATDKDIPIDGIVVSFNDIAYAQSCGRTGHHYKDGLAYKFEDDLHESLLQYIEWTPGRTGEIAPVAVFTPVESMAVRSAGPVCTTCPLLRIWN